MTVRPPRGPRWFGAPIRSLLTVQALLFVACSEGGGPGSTVTAEAWAARVCGATADWIDEIEGLNAGLQQHLDASSLEALRDSTVAYFDDILASTDRMIRRVRKAGVPDVEGGATAAEHVASGLADARAALRDARDRAAALGTDDPGRFNDELRRIGEEVAGSLTDVADSMARFRSPALDAASADVPQCRRLAA